MNVIVISDYNFVILNIFRPPRMQLYTSVNSEWSYMNAVTANNGQTA